MSKAVEKMVHNLIDSQHAKFNNALQFFSVSMPMRLQLVASGLMWSAHVWGDKYAFFFQSCLRANIGRRMTTSPLKEKDTVYLPCKVCLCRLCIFWHACFHCPHYLDLETTLSSRARSLCWYVHTLKGTRCFLVDHVSTPPPPLRPQPLCILLGRVSNPRQPKQVDYVHFVNGRSISLSHVTFLSAIVSVTSQLHGDSWRLGQLSMKIKLHFCKLIPMLKNE